MPKIDKIPQRLWHLLADHLHITAVLVATPGGFVVLQRLICSAHPEDAQYPYHLCKPEDAQYPDHLRTSSHQEPGQDPGQDN